MARYKSKQVCLGHYDKDGVFVPSQKRLAEQVAKVVNDKEETQDSQKETPDDSQPRTIAKAEGRKE